MVRNQSLNNYAFFLQHKVLIIQYYHITLPSALNSIFGLETGFIIQKFDKVEEEVELNKKY